jgi:serine protease Do
MLRVISFMTALVFAAIPALAQDSGWIGVSIEDQKDNGAIVRRIEPNSPAEKAGLREGDVILEFNKEDVVGVQKLTRLVRETPVGRTVDVKVRRDNREQTFKVTTERALAQPRNGRFELDVPGVHILADRIIRDMPRVQVNTTYIQAGIRVEQLTDQLRDFFGVFSNGGVLVTSVDQGSAADKAGLKAGDVITAVAGRNIRTPSDFSREMRSVGSKGTLKVFRDKKEREIKID